jgi:hypothetical protein
MTDPAPETPSMKKRVGLTLFLVLPFVVLIVLMYTIAISISEQGKELHSEEERPSAIE